MDTTAPPSRVPAQIVAGASRLTASARTSPEFGRNAVLQVAPAVALIFTAVPSVRYRKDGRIGSTATMTFVPLPLWISLQEAPASVLL